MTLSLPHRISATAVAVALLLSLTPAVPAAADGLYLANGRGPTDLYEVDLGLNTARWVLTFNFADKVHALTFCPDATEGHVLYAIGRENASVARIDPAAGAENVVGALPSVFRDAVVQASCDRDGTLFFTDTVREELWRLDLATCPSCAPQLVGRVETGVAAADVDIEGADIQHDVDGSLHLLTNSDGKALYRLDETTAMATFVGTVDTGFNNGLAKTLDQRLVVSSNDDNLYEIDPFDASVLPLGKLWDGAGLLELESGDLGSPTPFECELTVTTDRDEVAVGERLGWSIYLRHHGPNRVEGRFYYWISEADGTPVTGLQQSQSQTVDYLDEFEFQRAFTVPASMEPGDYRIEVRIRSMKQGLAVASASFRVVE